MWAVVCLTTGVFIIHNKFLFLVLIEELGYDIGYFQSPTTICLLGYGIYVAVNVTSIVIPLVKKTINFSLDSYIENCGRGQLCVELREGIQQWPNIPWHQNQSSRQLSDNDLCESTENPCIHCYANPKTGKSQ